MKKTVYVFANTNSFILHNIKLFSAKFDLKLFHLRYPLEKMSDAEFSLQQIDEIKAYNLYLRGLMMNPYRTFFDHYTIERIKDFVNEESPSYLFYEFTLFSDSEKSIVRFLSKEFNIPIIAYLPKKFINDESLSGCIDLGIQKVYSDFTENDILTWTD